MSTASCFPDFEYTADQLRKFIFASDFFTIMLKNSDIVQFAPKDIAAFEAWLTSHNIENIRTSPPLEVRRK